MLLWVYIALSGQSLYMTMEYMTSNRGVAINPSLLPRIKA